MRRLGFALAASTLALALAVGGSAKPLRRPITQADSGRTFRVAGGGTLTLRLSGRWAWRDPHTSSRAVRLTPVEYFVDPGFREWQIEARAPGRAVVSTLGTTEGGLLRRFRVVILVTS
jgi:hypothetical protein